MIVDLKRRRFTVEEYQRMAEAGILKKEDRVELIEGEILEMSPIGPRHAMCVIVLNRLFVSLLQEHALVSVQGPLRLGSNVEFQPDVLLLRPRADGYWYVVPAPADVLLAVEVADTSLDRDRRKLGQYASGGVPEVWIIDLEGDMVEVHGTPSAGSYQVAQRVRRGQQVSPGAFPQVVLTVDELLG